MKSLLTIALVPLVWLAGCKKPDEDLAKKTGEKVGDTLAGFAAGVGKGMDKQMTVKAELSAALTEQGVSMTVAKSTALDPSTRASASRPTTSDSRHKAITLYLVAARPLKATLIAKALNKDGQEVGRSTADVDFAADDAQYVTFGFPNEMDTQLVEKYLIDIRN